MEAKSVRKYLVVLFLVLLAVLPSCQKYITSIEDTWWKLRSYGQSQDMKIPYKNVELTIFFDSVEKVARGQGGFNAYFFDYFIEGKKLEISNPSTIQLFMLRTHVKQQEAEYLELLELVEGFELEDNVLTIYCGDSRLVYEPN